MNTSTVEQTLQDRDLTKPVIVWFRDDLRISDHPALAYAASIGAPVLCVYVHDEETDGIRIRGAAQKWFLHQSLNALSDGLSKIGGRLDILRGPSAETILDLAERMGATGVYWLRRAGDSELAIDSHVKSALKEVEIEARSFNGNLLHEPSKVSTGSGGFYKVYSPFWRALDGSGDPRPPEQAPETLQSAVDIEEAISLASLNLLPENPNWAEGWEELWPAGEAGARKRLEAFLNNGLEGYGDGRDFPAKTHVSRLSPYLRHGVLSPYQAWHGARNAQAENKADSDDTVKFLKELAWREFAYHLLFHFPKLANDNFQDKFDGFPWRSDYQEDLKRWQRGQTGYPIVDAGMRELWQTGYMHNRVRMIVGSFLVKHLLIDWREGEHWFWDTLVDADPANNTASWQWIAGSGADAAPYFRVFNPILQGEKFDGKGHYVRQYVPEIAELPNKFIHRPWEAPGEILSKAGVTLGETYPEPIVDHAKARQRALNAFEQTKKAS